MVVLSGTNSSATEAVSKVLVDVVGAVSVVAVVEVELVGAYRAGSAARDDPTVRLETRYLGSMVICLLLMV